MAFMPFTARLQSGRRRQIRKEWPASAGFHLITGYKRWRLIPASAVRNCQLTFFPRLSQSEFQMAIHARKVVSSPIRPAKHCFRITPRVYTKLSPELDLYRGCWCDCQCNRTSTPPARRCPPPGESFGCSIVCSIVCSIGERPSCASVAMTCWTRRRARNTAGRPSWPPGIAVRQDVRPKLSSARALAPSPYPLV